MKPPLLAIRKFFNVNIVVEDINLINCAWNEAGDVFLVAEDEREGGGEGGNGLDGGEHDLPDVCALAETEDAANLKQLKKEFRKQTQRV